MGTLFSKEFNPETDVGDLSGKVIIVTGGKWVFRFFFLSSLCVCVFVFVGFGLSFEFESGGLMHR